MKKLIEISIVLFSIVLLPSCSNNKIKGDANSSENNNDTIVTDIDGNVYHTVTIGAQVWMVENLKTTKYRNGVSIDNVTDQWQQLKIKTGAYCNYDNDVNNSKSYGRLYNWHALNDSRGLCPKGWHIPSDNEWKTLEMFLGMSQSSADTASGWRGKDEGGKLKSASNLWESPNTGATNSSGFSALPSGRRIFITNYCEIGECGNYWTSTLYGDGAVTAYYRSLRYNDAKILREITACSSGNSCRCIKD